MKNLLSILFFVLFATTFSVAQNAQQLVADMIETLGGKQTFYNLGNVTYDFSYHDPNSSLILTSKETYVFDGELSYGDFSEHGFLGANGKALEGYDGKNAWVKFNGKVSADKKANGVARFLRKTNYYWFTMFFKLQDKGVNLKHIGTKKVEDRDYDLVKVTFGDSIGDAQDTYVLYINKRTKLVDQFLFTIVAFGVKKPKLMKVRYGTFHGIKIPYDRVYIDSNWNGDIVGKKWVTTYWSNIKFSTKIDKSIFSK